MKVKDFSVTNVTCERANQVLFNPVTFSLQPGNLLHIQGTNGVGKTTLLRSLTGLARPHSGEICWDKQSIFDNDAYKKQLTFLGHKNAIKSSLTVYENLSYSASFPKQDPEHQQAVISKIGLLAKRNSLVGSLSSGQKQRLALARLLLSTAAIWILDEPLSFLDSQGLDLIQELVMTHLKSGGITIMTSHQPIDCLFTHYLSLELNPFVGANEEGS